MKTIKNVAKQNTSIVSQQRSFRRFVKQMFASLFKRQTCNHQAEFQKVLEKLQGIEDLIDIIAREIARQAKQGK